MGAGLSSTPSLRAPLLLDAEASLTRPVAHSDIGFGRPAKRRDVMEAARLDGCPGGLP